MNPGCWGKGASGQRPFAAFTLLTVCALLLSACAGTRVEPLMPTPVVFSELDLGPLDHIPEDRRW
ncbi:MAG: hypothetical protein ACOCVP_05810, partial [Wenzhouxiangella sp.]